MGLVMLCSLVSFFWWLVCRGDVGWWSWCCDSRDCGGHGVELKLAWLWLCIGRSWGIRVSLWFEWWLMFDCDFLGCICLMRVLWSRECCDFERFVRCDLHCCVDQSYEVIILWGDYCWVVVILDSWVGVVSCDSWGGFGGVSGWFAYDRDWVRCRGWGFVLVSILSAFVAYVVIWLVFWGWLVGSRWRFVF